MADIIIFGAGDIAELAHFYFGHDSDHRPAAFVVDGEYLKETHFQGLPVIALEDLQERFPATDYSAFVAISYTGLNKIRTDKCRTLRSVGYNLVSYVSSKATTFADLAHGDNCFILEDNTIQPRVHIGSNVTLWSGNHIGHHSVIEDNVFVASQAVISGGVRIGEGSFIGVNATIRDHVSIGRKTVVGAGVLILADAPDESVFIAPAPERSRVPSSRLRRI